MKHLQTANGTGRVWTDGNKDCGTTRYRIEVDQETSDDGTVGIKRITGQVYDLDTSNLQDTGLVLELEDGRELPFVIMDSSGEIAERGGFATPE